MTESKVLADYMNNDGVSINDLIKALDSIQNDIYAKKSERTKDTVRQLFILGLNDINHLFPNLNIKPTSHNPKDYIKKWLKRYYDAVLPSLSTPKDKGSADDPALAIMIKKRESYTDTELRQAISIHNLFMSAENIQGALLEEYINEHASLVGWIWAKGECMRACDFIRRNSSGITELVQIKNRDNTENSSSSAIRQGTQITKWFRLKTRKKNGRPYPTFEWEKINNKMQIPVDKEMSEENYNQFLKNVMAANPNLISKH